MSVIIGNGRIVVDGKDIIINARKADMTDKELKTATRDELQGFLEARGFAVYASETTKELRVAARLQAAQERKEGR
jgi:hypothetical protein